jgi:hypothetical protein
VISVLNTCRADLYRLSRGKALYISFILFMLAIVFQLLTGERAANFAVSFGDGSGDLLASSQAAVSSVALTASSAPLLVMLQFQTLVLIALVLIYAISASDFNSSAIQNAIASGISRPGIYFSKLFLSFALIELFYVVALVVGIALGAFVGGVGEVSEGHIFSTLRAFGVQSLMVLTIASVGTAIIFITRRGAALNIIYLLFIMGASTVLLAVSVATGVDYLAYDFLSNTALVANFDQLSPEQVSKMLSTVVVYLALSTVLGLASFRRVAIR